MNRTQVYMGDEYQIWSYGNGTAYEIVRDDGDSRFVQDEGAAAFRESIDGTSEVWTIDDACSDYFAD